MDFGNPGQLYFDLKAQDEKARTDALDRQMKQANVKQQELANIYAEQNNPLLLQQQQQKNEYNTQIQPAKIKDELADFAKKASQAELDQMYIEAQKMMYKGIQSKNKEMFDMGQKLYGTHKDFMKIREQGTVKQEAATVKFDRDQELAKLRASLRPAKTGSSGGSTPKSMDQLQRYYTQLAVDADAKGDASAAQQYHAQANYVASQLASRRTDTAAGKPTLTPEGTIGKTPPREGPKLPSAAKQPSLPSGWTMK